MTKKQLQVAASCAYFCGALFTGASVWQGSIRFPLLGIGNASIALGTYFLVRLRQ